jgi:inhibitor of cysteine peptidase
MTYTEQDNGASVALRSGETFAVRLRENPTTGTRWTLADCSPSVLAVTRNDYHPPDTAVYGAGGEHVWEFVARAPGQCALRLVEHRRWEGGPPVQTFSLDVSVS